MFGKTNSSILNGSITKGVSLTHENTSTSNPIINNNITINNDNDNQSSEKLSSNYSQEFKEIKEEKNNDQSIEDLQAENEFLRAILKIYINQKLYFSGKNIVCSSEELCNLIQLLTKADEIEIENESIEVSCLGNPKLPYSKIVNIWVIKDGQKSIFKYIYSHYLSLFDECKISLKVIRVIEP